MNRNWRLRQLTHNLALAGIGALLLACPALADDKPTEAEAAKIKSAVEAWGCSGGTYEKESEGSGMFEVDDAKCKAGQYDFRLDKDFNIVTVTRD